MSVSDKLLEIFALRDYMKSLKTKLVMEATRAGFEADINSNLNFSDRKSQTLNQKVYTKALFRRNETDYSLKLYCTCKTKSIFSDPQNNDHKN